MASKLSEIRELSSVSASHPASPSSHPANLALATSPLVKDLMTVAEAADQLLSAIHKCAHADVLRGLAYTQNALQAWTEAEKPSARMPAEQRQLQAALSALTEALDWRASSHP